MFSDPPAFFVILLPGIGLAALLVALLILLGRWRTKRRQARLEKAFLRARQVQRTGSGIQGTPYSLYGEPSWSEESDRDG